MDEQISIMEMAKTPPAGFSRIDTIIKNGAGSIVNVIGVVSDIMPIAATSGSDLQMTLTIRDHGLNVNGIRVKLFKEKRELMPCVTQNGDIILLRSLKIAIWRGELMGISSWRTQHLVFPCDSIVGPESRLRYATGGSCLKFSSSVEARGPSIHEQQWVISLHYQEGWQHQNSSGGAEHTTEPGSEPPTQRSATYSLLPDLPTTTTSTTKNFTDTRSPGSTISVAKTKVPIIYENKFREKFSLLKDVSIDKFYDLSGDVVKLFSGSFDACVEMYISDYTSNDMLPDYHITTADTSGKFKRIPRGRMTLKVELRPPHAQWALINIKEGNFVLLKNVRVKWSNGGQVEGNMWPDRLHQDRVNIVKLEPNSPQYEDLAARKTMYIDGMKAQLDGTATDAVNGNLSKKESKGKRKRKRKAAQLQAVVEAEKAAKESKEIVVTDESNNDKDDFAKQHESDTNSSHSQPLTKKKLNPRVQCMHEDIRLSTFSEMVNNPRRVAKNLKTNEPFGLPFINVKHRVKLRIVDFYPHDIREFAREFPDAKNPSVSKWEWDFWLVVCAGDVNDPEKKRINVCVGGQSATDLLDDDATDLRAKPRTLQRLQNTLWTLWGDLAEQKDKFLQSHPKIPNDEHFTAAKYNIMPNNIPFQACIAEYGIQIPSTDTLNRENRRLESRNGTELASQVAPR